MSTPDIKLGHAAFHPYAGTPEHLRSAGNLPKGVPIVTGNAEQDAFLRVAELERENALLLPVYKAAVTVVFHAKALRDVHGTEIRGLTALDEAMRKLEAT